MNLVVTMAIGDSMYGEFCLNLAASIKANTPNQKILIIYNESAVETIKPLMGKMFDYGYLYYGTPYSNPAELSFYLKTLLWEIATTAVPQAEKFLFLDADTIMIAGRSVDEWFEKHAGKYFAAYCNDVFDYSTGKRKRKDYTFWCDPKDAKTHFKLSENDKLPQINSSFLYFDKSTEAEWFFKTAHSVWNDNEFKYTLYRGAKPDELCFNIACAIGGILPSEKPSYRPIFFQFVSENQNLPYILHYFKSFGFAGNQKPREQLIDFYNELADYYRAHFGIVNKFRMEASTKLSKSLKSLSIEAVSRRTLHRRGEVENSEAGIFNPSGIVLSDGSRMTIYRKEKGLNAKKQYSHGTAIPYVHVLSSDRDEAYELELEGFDKNLRVEDFRLFLYEDKVYCSHSVIANNLRDDMTCEVGVSLIHGKKLCFQYYARPDIKRGKVEKNYAFFQDENKDLYLVYSLSPYILFKRVFGGWVKVEVMNPDLDWMHKDQFICNSTHPILIGEHYLMFFHTKESGQYFQGAVLINKDTKEIDYCTPYSIPIKTGNEGMVPKMNYVSGAMVVPKQNVVRLFIGEGDSHSVINDFNTEQLINTIKRHKVWS